jgi:hypothetical protein
MLKAVVAAIILRLLVKDILVKLVARALPKASVLTLLLEGISTPAVVIGLVVDGALTPYCKLYKPIRAVGTAAAVVTVPPVKAAVGAVA